MKWEDALQVSFLQAAALGCRMTTAYRAARALSHMPSPSVLEVMQQGRLQPGETLAVFGCGGLGLSAVPGCRLRSF